MGITEVSIVEALFIALSGILVVFMMLAILSVVITAISSIAGEKESGAPAAVPAENGDDASPEDVPYGGTVRLLNVDEKTAACVMAIVSHETGIPLNQLVFKSIRSLDE